MDLRDFAAGLMRVTEAHAPAGVPMILAVGAVRCGETLDLEVIMQQADQAVAAAEEYIGRLAREAHASAIADKRKTIMDADIQQAREKLR